ncbi:MAG: cytochrome c3 family protein [Gemmatimonadota bacterium]
MKAMGSRATPVLLLLAGAMAAGSCVDEDVVFDDRPIYERVATEAGGFVGYADPSDDDKLTVCGACHRDAQAEWETTGHADAWAGLQSSEAARAFCEACHTVNSLGNIVPEPTPGEAVGGHAAIETEHGRYQDVQCESCHGPGLDHVLEPGAGNVPLAPIQVGADLTFGCAECHSGFHHPFVEEWKESPHAHMNRGAARNQEDGCYLCHSGEGALLAFGVTADYLEKDELLASDEFAQLTCAVCHDPHGSENEAQLRFPVHTTDVDRHLCAACHDLRPRPDTDIPQDYLITHAPAAGLMAGNAGWFPPGSGLEPGAIRHPHATAERLCASCHVVTYETVDEATGEEFFSQGHLFRGAPCVDEDGRPTSSQACGFGADERDYRGCLECHSSEERAAELLRSALSEFLPEVRALAALLSQVDPNGRQPGGEIDADDFRFTTAEGALFTLSVALSADGLPSNDAQARRNIAAALMHNPTLVRELVDAAIEALEAEYGVAASTAQAPPASWWDSWEH